MKKSILIILLSTIIIWGCTQKQKERNYFELENWFDSWRSWSAVLEWYFYTQDRLDLDFFMWEPEKEHYCNENTNLWWTEICPTNTVVIFSRSNWQDIPWQLFLRGEPQKQIDLWCIENNELFHDSYAEGFYDTPLFNNDEEIIKKIQTHEKSLIKINKSAYNISWRWLWNCDINIQNIEIL